MNRKTKVRTCIGIGAVASMLLAGIFANTAEAYSLYPNYSSVSYSVVYNNESGGGLNRELAMTRTGDQFQVVENGQYPALFNGLMYAAVEQATIPDGKGSWPIIQADMTTNRTGNGYLLIATPSESNDFATWVKRLGGNPSFIENYMQSHNETIQLKDYATNQTYTYYPFSLMVNESGAIFGNPTAVPNGKIYRDANNGQSYPEYTLTQHINTSRPPVATSLSAVDATTGSANITQGDPITFTAKSTVYMYSSIAGGETTGHHYDSIELRNNSTGKTYWVAGSGSSDITSMKNEIGGHGYFTNTFTYNSALPTGSYTASFWVGDEVDRIGATPATTTFTIAPSGEPAISLNANPASTTAGQSSTLTATASNVPSGDIIKIIDKSGADTLSGANSYTNNQMGATQLQTQATSQTAQTVNYEAELVNKATGSVSATANTSVQWGLTWVQPAIVLSANPTRLGSGQTSTVSFVVNTLPLGDTVSITGATTSGAPVLSETSFTASGSYRQVQSPTNGQTTTAHYVATVLNELDQVIATSNTVDVTWTSVAPSISITANPKTMMSGQSSTVTYTVGSGGLPPGDTITVTGSGNATHPWSTSGQTYTTENYRETETPNAGQTITETYTATIYNSGGQALSSATTTVKWVNAWDGTIHLTGNPTTLAVGKSTTLTATTSAPIPSGYTLVVYNQETGQIVTDGTTSPLVGQYASGAAKTYDFGAYVTDAYAALAGPASNTVQVQWVGATVSANPPALDINHASTITANAQNMPSGDWLILYDKSTGQVIGTTQSSTLSVSQSQSTAQTDTYVAYVSPTEFQSNEFVASNPITVDWYSVTITGNPTSLPVSNPTTLTATAQNIPSGYVLMIVDQTTSKIVAQGTAGQTTLIATQVKSTPEKNTYVAEVAVPPNTGSDTVSPPTWLTNDANYVLSIRPKVAIDSTGTKHVVFESYAYDSSIANIGYFTISPSGVQSPTVWLTTSKTAASYAPDIAVGSNGVSHIVFGSYLYNPGAENLAYMTVNATGTPSGITWLMKNTSGYAGIYPSKGVRDGYEDTRAYNSKTAYYDTAGPSIAVDTNGVSHVVFNSVNYNATTLRYDTWNAAYMTVGASGTPSPVDWLTTSTLHSSTAPDIAVDTSGTSHIVYQSSLLTTNDTNVAYATVASTGTKSATTWLTQNTTYGENSRFPHIAVDGSGTSHVSFASEIYSYQNYQASSYNIGYMTVSAWNTPSGIAWLTTYPGTTGAVNEFTDSAIQVDSAGKSHIAYAMLENAYYGSPEVGYATVSATGSVTSNTWITTNLTTESFEPTLVLAPKGVVDLFFASNAENAYTDNIADVTISPPSTIPTTIAATSSPVTIQWYRWQLALAASPTSLNEGNPTTLTATSTGAPAGSLIQIWDKTANKMVGQSAVDAASLTATWTEQQAITDTFVAYFVDPSTGKHLQGSNNVKVTWKKAPLTIFNAMVTHTPGWLKNLKSYNAYYATRDPSLVRPLSYFWAGEEFVFKAEPSVSTIAQATVTISDFNYSSYVPIGAPMEITVNLTYNPATGLLEGNSNPKLATWFQYLKNGTYTAAFWVKSKNNQVATAQASFTIDAPWVSGNDPKTYFHEHQTW